MKCAMTRCDSSILHHPMYSKIFNFGTDADGGFEWLTTIDAGIELLSIGCQGAGVMHNHGVTLLREVHIVSASLMLNLRNINNIYRKRKNLLDGQISNKTLFPRPKTISKQKYI